MAKPKASKRPRTMADAVSLCELVQDSTPQPLEETHMTQPCEEAQSSQAPHAAQATESQSNEIGT